MKFNKEHWENIYANKNANEVSWTENNPTISLQFIEDINLSKSAKIIDVGGGESFFAEALLNNGYQNITVVDISLNAIQKAKERLGTNAKFINWVVADITNFSTTEKFDFWHDRAVFHFLVDENDIIKYKELLLNTTAESAYFLLGTFSTSGPIKCSGLNIKQYSKLEMETLFSKHFTLIKDYNQNHITPFNTVQNFQFAGFQKKNIITVK